MSYQIGPQFGSFATLDAIKEKIVWAKMLKKIGLLAVGNGFEAGVSSS